MTAATAVKAPGQSPRARLRAFLGRHRSISILIGMSIITVLLPFIVTLPPLNGFNAQSVWIDAFATAGIYVLLALGLNVVVGLAGLLDLGYAAFFAIGAYTYAFGASGFTDLHIPFWPMLLVGALVAAVFGILLGAPTLRLRGDYLAIVTLGFGEIVPVVFRNADFRLQGGPNLTNGTNGIAAIDRPSLPSLDLPPFDLGFIHFNGHLDFLFSSQFPLMYYVVMAVIIAFSLILVYRLQDSRLGRAWQAIREDELAAASNGVNTVTTKLLAFALGATTSGLAGVFSASKLVFVSPDQFGFTVSFTILAMVVLGGMGNAVGVALGAFIIYITQAVLLHQLTNFFEPLNIPILSEIDFTKYNLLLYGIALVAMMLLRPQGLFPSRQRARELHTAAGEDPMEASPEGVDAEGTLA
ncbi:MAG TPA: ABC transporter ATP-binding protein [Candidatus Limnocylindria bacterium]|nr:ABC transporter ATP-binding protein [Candidatus Limnocylindria bacterium]